MNFLYKKNNSDSENSWKDSEFDLEEAQETFDERNVSSENSESYQSLSHSSNNDSGETSEMEEKFWEKVPNG